MTIQHLRSGARRFGYIALLLFLGACEDSGGGGSNEGGEGAEGSENAGQEADTGTDVPVGEENGEAGEESGAECSMPSGAPGTSLGDLFDVDAVLQDCDGNPVALRDVMCGYNLTLIDIGAGWCQPCIEAAEKLEEEIVAPFQGQGLQVISVLFQNEAGQPANTQFCKQWRDNFGLTTPVLIDPTFVLEPYFDANQQAAPVNMLIDADSRIVFVKAGTPATDLDQTIATELSK